MVHRPFCYGNEASDRHACMNEHLPTANQSEIRFANLNSVFLMLRNALEAYGVKNLL